LPYRWFGSSNSTRQDAAGDNISFAGLNNNVNVFDDGLPQSFSHINNFNVLVGGSNVLYQDSRYGYQHFNNDF
jgi:hypothetical protein